MTVLLRIASIRRAFVRSARVPAGTVLVASFLLCSTAAAQPDSTALPPAQTLIDRHVTALGGRDAVLRLRSYQQRVVFEIASIGLRGEGTIHAAAPDFTLTRMSIPAIGVISGGTNGPVSWTINPIQGPRVLPDAEMAQSREQADFFGNLMFPSDRYATMETIGRATFNGQAAYTVRLVRKDGQRESLRYFSVESGLLIGSETSATSELGTFRTTLSLSDYRRFGELLFPTRSESNAGTSRLIITVQSISFNDVDPAVFVLPDAIKALITP